MTTTHIPGYPRIGAQRELKIALEAHWRGDTSLAELEQTASALRHANWHCQKAAGLAYVTAGDFSLYDCVLDHALIFGVPPARFGIAAGEQAWAARFGFARGTAGQPALAMKKWFDTNYHYLVPEIDPEQGFELHAGPWLAQLCEAQAAGYPVKPVLIGPVSFLRLARSTREGASLAACAAALGECYAQLLARLAGLGIEWVQIDEPVLALDLEPEWQAAFAAAWAPIGRAGSSQSPRRLLATYFGSVAHSAGILLALPIHGVHLDLVRAPEQIETVVPQLPGDWVLSAGVIDGRNVWRSQPGRILPLLQRLQAVRSGPLWLAPSCSLLHVPVSLQGESGLDPALRSWLSFAEEKLVELQLYAGVLDDGEDAHAEALTQARTAALSRARSSQVLNEGVRRRAATLAADADRRHSPYAQRSHKQRARFQLPLLPTTSIGSFPQTAHIRGLRAARKRGRIGELAYLEAMREEIRAAIHEQEALGLDVLVHGEAERNDMVEYFGERLWGYAFTANGWVQSYGSRCVKPPIIYGDVFRPEAMTVDTARFAQSLSRKPVKGMLTGPVTMLQWSFVRDDQPRADTALQIALAIRSEVAELEAAGIHMIQIDEPAFREGLPLRREDWPAYLDWAARVFRVAASAVADETQIHTHMCYSEFNDILPAIAAMDADVITIETSRSQMALLDGFGDFAYPNEIGPGVYDIHSPRLPTVEEMCTLLERACALIPPERLWVNPDCGLKTRDWPETRAALSRMVEAAAQMRTRLARRQRVA